MSNKYLKLVTAYLKQPSHYVNYMKLFTQSKVINAEEGKVAIELDVLKEHTNPMGTLHGGCSATLIDFITSVACIVSPVQKTGVSVDMTINYLSSAKVGDTIIVEGNILKLGKRIAFSQGNIYLKKDNSLIVTGLHTIAFPSFVKKFEI
uniref:Acyl-coenzyme A thioesterase 13 n=1 Tax=Parastrongyloides trichosuri TaxID=131310 RepID=A0A0N4ZU76_PARTI